MMIVKIQSIYLLYNNETALLVALTRSLFEVISYLLNNIESQYCDLCGPRPAKGSHI